MPKFYMPTFGNGRKNTKTACICFYRVRFPTCIGKPRAIFCQDSARLCSPCGEVVTRSVSTVYSAPLISCHWVLRAVGREPMCAASKVCQLGDCVDRLAHAWQASLQPQYLFCYRIRYRCLAVIGYIYLRLKPYLVVKISSDIVTEQCCQVCIMSMMFCRSDCLLCADMVSDCAIRKLLRKPCGLT